jgi:hypothetical protein
VAQPSPSFTGFPVHLIANFDKQALISLSKNSTQINPGGFLGKENPHPVGGDPWKRWKFHVGGGNFQVISRAPALMTDGIATKTQKGTKT